MKKDKQILIDYEEYLELEECRQVLEDLKTEIDFNGKVAVDPLDPMSVYRYKSTIPMPDSFKRYFSNNYTKMPLLKITIQAEEV